MKKVRFHLLNVSLIVLATSCSVTEKISQWQDKSITPDGIPAEYSIPLPHYDPDTKIQYTFSNDLDNLYFCIRATEEEAQTKILRAGVQILIDTTGKEKAFVSIRFPLPHARNQGPSVHDIPNLKPESNDSNMTKPPTGFKGDMKLLFGLEEMQLDGFKGSINGRIPVNSHGIMFAIKIDSDKNMTFEGVIPFKTFYKDKLSASDNMKPFNISISLNAMKPPQKESLKDITLNENAHPDKGKSGEMHKGSRMNRGGMRNGNETQQSEGDNRAIDRGKSIESIKLYPFEKVNTIKIKYKLALILQQH